MRTAELQFFLRHLAYTGVSLPYQFGLFGKGALNQQIWSDDLRRRDKILDSLYRPYINNIQLFRKKYGYNAEMANAFKNFYLGNLYGDKLYASRKIDEPLQKRVAGFYKDSVSEWMNILDCYDCENIMSYNVALRKIAAILFDDSNEAAFFDAVHQLKNEKNKDFLLSRYAYERMEITANRDQLLKSYFNLCADTIYQDQVFAAYNRFNQLPVAAKDELGILIKADKSAIEFSKLMASLRGKVVYIDFWASWCQPCIAEFPYSLKLHEKLKGKQVVMMYLSVDTDRDSWLEARKKHGIAGVHSYLLDNSENSLLAQKIGLGPIPRYIIIDKEGRIVRLNAARPTDPEIYDTLMQILEQ